MMDPHSQQNTSKSARILVDIANADGLTFTEIQRRLWRMSHPAGEPFTRDLRGYWCTNLLGGFFYHGGLLRHFCTKGKDGKWRRNTKVPFTGQPWHDMAAAGKAGRGFTEARCSPKAGFVDPTGGLFSR